LTDETAFENFKKYGNPDGPGSYNVAIALPRFLLAPDNQISVLCCAFFILLVVIPGSLYINFGDSTMKDENGVMMQNKREYGARLNENLLPKNIPLILSQSIEFQSIEMTDDAELAIFKKMKSNEDIDELVPKTTSRRNQDMNIKPLLLVLGHIFRDENVKSPYFKDGLSEILKQGVNHLNMMIDTSMELNALARTGASAKKMGYSAISSIINFQQFFVQGLWTSNDPMM
jgi:translocation protein SEC63